jgi:hypothetical protein
VVSLLIKRLFVKFLPIVLLIWSLLLGLHFVQIDELVFGNIGIHPLRYVVVVEQIGGRLVALGAQLVTSGPLLGAPGGQAAPEGAGPHLSAGSHPHRSRPWLEPPPPSPTLFSSSR